LPAGALAVSGGALLAVDAPYLQGPFQVFHVRGSAADADAMLETAGGVPSGESSLPAWCLTRHAATLAGGGSQMCCRKGPLLPCCRCLCAGHGAITGPQPALQHFSASGRIRRCGAAASCRYDMLHMTCHTAATACCLPLLLVLVANAAFSCCCLQSKQGRPMQPATGCLLCGTRSRRR
jgi:hypothetical protein